MDLTPQLFRDVQFTERRGAYDSDEVDAFLARVGTAVGQLQERLREAQRRIEASEDQIAKLEAAAREQQDADETLRRTLVLAQRTADAAVAEAKEEADGIVAEARKKADELVVQAEEAVRRDVGATRDRLQAEIRDLETERDQVRARIAVITEHLDSERARLHTELDAINDFLDDASRSGLAPVPGAEDDPVIVLGDPSPESEHATEPELKAVDDDFSQLPPPPEDWQSEAPVARAERSPDPAADEPPTGSLFGDGDVPEAADDGPPTQANPIISPGSGFGGSHLDELRRAVSDDAPESEADAAMAAFFDQDTDTDEPSRRFGRRR